MSNVICRALLRALCFAILTASAPLHAQEDVQSQLNQIQASLRQLKGDYEQRIAALESQINQLQRANAQPGGVKSAQRLAKTESVEEAITAVAPPPAAATPQSLPNLGQNDRTLQFGASLILDAKYSAQSQNPQNAYAGTLPNGAEGIPRGFSIGETELAISGALALRPA